MARILAELAVALVVTVIVQATVFWAALFALTNRKDCGNRILRDLWFTSLKQWRIYGFTTFVCWVTVFVHVHNFVSR
jgi:hypothetical protein